MEKNVLAEGRSPIADVDLTSSADASKVLGRFVGSRNSVGLVGFEPTASASRTQRSTKLSHSPNCPITRRSPRCDRSIAYYALNTRGDKRKSIRAVRDTKIALWEWDSLSLVVGLAWADENNQRCCQTDRPPRLNMVTG